MMGFTPEQVDRMSPWQFQACVIGWNKGHGSDKPEPPTPEEFDRMISQSIH